jgi:hypothetical protein
MPRERRSERKRDRNETKGALLAGKNLIQGCSDFAHPSQIFAKAR